MVSLSVIALAVGALSIPFAFFALNGGGVFLSLIFALGGLVLGALGILRDPERSGLALVGIACSVLGARPDHRHHLLRRQRLRDLPDAGGAALHPLSLKHVSLR